MIVKDLVQSYYTSLNQKNNRWQELYSEDAVFSDASQILVAKGKKEIVQSFTTFLKGMESVKIKYMIVEGESACAIASYVYSNQKGEKMNQDVAEVWEVKDGKLATLTIYFDLTAYRNFMGG